MAWEFVSVHFDPLCVWVWHPRNRAWVHPERLTSWASTEKTVQLCLQPVTNQSISLACVWNIWCVFIRRYNFSTGLKCCRPPICSRIVTSQGMWSLSSAFEPSPEGAEQRESPWPPGFTTDILCNRSSALTLSLYIYISVPFLCTLETTDILLPVISNSWLPLKQHKWSKERTEMRQCSHVVELEVPNVKRVLFL